MNRFIYTLKALEDLAEEYYNNVEIINLSGENLTEIPIKIFKLKRLSHIYLWSNQIISIPTDIKELVNLEIIGLSNNLINTIPSEILLLPKLKKLVICNNPLNEIPEWLQQMINKKIVVTTYFKTN